MAANRAVPHAVLPLPGASWLNGAMPRARELGLVPPGLPTGPLNAVTDVAGVQVGHATLPAGEGALRPPTGRAWPRPTPLRARVSQAAVYG